MSDEASEKRSSSTGWVTGMIVVLILYVLAPGPYLLLFRKGIIKTDTAVGKALGICLWPLGKLSGEVKPVRSFYEAYLKALGINYR